MVHQFVSERFSISLSRSGCLNYLHRLGFVLKRPKKRLVRADARKRECFVAEYAALTQEVRRFGAKIFLAGEAHFRADAGLRGKWVLRGEPALVDSSSPRWGEKASYYSAVSLETGAVEWMELEGNGNGESSVAFLEQLRERHGGRLNVIWDNAPALLGHVPALRKATNLGEYLSSEILHVLSRQAAFTCCVVPLGVVYQRQHPGDVLLGQDCLQRRADQQDLRSEGVQPWRLALCPEVAVSRLTDVVGFLLPRCRPGSIGARNSRM